MIRKGIFFDMGVPASEENAEELSEKIAGIVGMSGRDCSKIWAKVSKWLEDPNLRETLRKKLL